VFTVAYIAWTLAALLTIRFVPPRSFKPHA